MVFHSLVFLAAVASADSFVPAESEIEVALETLALDRAAVRIATDRLPAGTPPVVRDALDDPVGSPARVARLAALADLGPPDLLRALPDLRSPVDGGDLDADERREVLADLPAAVFGDAPDRTLLEEHISAPAERARSARLGALAARARLDDLVETAAWILVRLADSDIATVRSVPGLTFLEGTEGPDTHVLRPAGPGEVIVVYDPGGDDVYAGAPVAARGGIAIVQDASGDDIYEADDDIAIGAAVGGVAVLVDRAGNDVYRGRRAAIGAGIAGIGLVVDDTGDDRYEVDEFGQGAAGPGGVGVLLDRAGDDEYAASGRSDIIRDPARRLSRAQGFATGLRPGGAGGVGILVDAGGRDLYRAENFAQGCAYWAAAGVLIDAGGDDRFLAHRYVQGAGVHLAVGALVDLAGRDLYDGWTMAQGAGHDLSVGLLLDAAGGDLYRANSLAQGGGSANGVGILVEIAGDDRYALDGDHGQGVGDFEDEVRRKGSVGVLVDLAGADAYSRAAAADGRAWRAGRWGIGKDSDRGGVVESEFHFQQKGDGERKEDGERRGDGGGEETGWSPPPLPRARRYEVVPPRAPAAGPDTAAWQEAFLVLSSGRAEHRRRHDEARRLLAADAPASLEWAAGFFDPEGPREWRALRDAAGAAGPRAGPTLARLALARAAAGETLAAVGLVHALGATGDSASWRVAAVLLDDAETAVRAAAAKALGDLFDGAATRPQDGYPAPAMPALARALEDASADVRRIAVDAIVRIGGSSLPGGRQALERALRDPDTWVRIAAREDCP